MYHNQAWLNGREGLAAYILYPNMIQTILHYIIVIENSATFLDLKENSVFTDHSILKNLIRIMTCTIIINIK